MTEDPKYFSLSLEKGLRILALFGRENSSVTQTEVSKALGLNMTSTYRYLNTFVTLGYLQKDPQTKRLSPGIRCLALCTNLMRATDNLGLIKRLIDQAFDTHRITIDVGFAVDDAMVRVYHREARETLTYHLPDVAANCLHNTSVGKAYLSGLPEDELQQVLTRITLQARTPRSIVDSAQLTAEIELTRRRGYALSVEEYLPGLITIGAPLIHQETTRSVGGVSFDFSILQHAPADIEQRYAALVIELAAALSELVPAG
jgi:DNA-binding IclR family transcriptional regulator